MSTIRQRWSRSLSPLRLGLAGIFLVLSCVLPFLLYRIGVIHSEDLLIVFTVAGIAATILIVIFDDIIEEIVSVYKAIKRHFNKQQILISYLIDDYMWSKWIYQQLTLAGYTVIMQLWNHTTNSRDFEKTMREASKDAKYIFSIVSPDYVKPIYGNPAWYHYFKRLLKRGDNMLIKVHRFELDVPLKDFRKIELMGPGVNETQARDLLRNGMPHGLRKSWVSSGGTIPANDETARFPGEFPEHWNIPSSKASFTDREEILKRLYTTFRDGRSQPSVAPQALFGLGGIGTSALAIEYANRHHIEYTAGYYVRISPDKEQEEDLREIGKILDLKEKGEKDLLILRQAIIDALNKGKDWLLIIDQCSGAAQIKEFMPRPGRGYVLLATQTSSLKLDNMDIAMVQVREMEKAEGALFLLRFIGRLDPDEPLSSNKISDLDRQVALAISAKIGGVPSALRCAGEFIIGNRSSLQEYLGLYETFKKELTSPEVCSWLVAYRTVQSTNQSAAKVLCFCALLGHDAIPEEIIYEAPGLRPFISDKGEFIKNISDLLKSSLLDRDSSNGMLNVPPIVQEVLKDEMDDATKRILAEQVVQALGKAFPKTVSYDNLKEVEKYISHARVCRDFVRDYQMKNVEAAEMFEQAALCQKLRGDITDADAFSRCAFEIRGIAV
jgi:TIR domain